MNINNTKDGLKSNVYIMGLLVNALLKFTLYSFRIECHILCKSHSKLNYNCMKIEKCPITNFNFNLDILN